MLFNDRKYGLVNEKTMINASIITKLLGLSDNSLYVNFKFGGTPEMQYKDYRFKAYLIGAGFSLQLVDSVDFIIGSWRGIARPAPSPSLRSSRKSKDGCRLSGALCPS